MRSANIYRGITFTSIWSNIYTESYLWMLEYEVQLKIYKGRKHTRKK